MIRKTLCTLLLAAGAAQAQPMPPGPHGPPPPGGGAPSAEALATVPDLDAAQQVEVRRILLQRRDAHDALRTKEDAERMALRTRYRDEHEKIDDDASARLRKLLGDDGYRNLATWLAPDRRGPGPMPPPGPRENGPRGPAPGPGAPRIGDAPSPPTPPEPDADDAQ